MAKIKNYIEIIDNLSEYIPGYARIYLNKPLIEFHLEEDDKGDNRWNNEIRYSLNGTYYLGSSSSNYDFGDSFNGIDIKYDFIDGLASPTNIENGSNLTINPIIPIGTIKNTIVSKPITPNGADQNVNTSIYTYFYNSDWWHSNEHEWSFRVRGSGMDMIAHTLDRFASKLGFENTPLWVYHYGRI